MKRILFLMLSLIVSITLISCEEEPLSGGGNPEIIGNELSFLEDIADKAYEFSSTESAAKEITLTKEKIYKFEVTPIFRGSKDARFREDNIEFLYDDSVFTVEYVGDENYQPTYELKANSIGTFTFTVNAGGYSQIISISVIE